MPSAFRWKRTGSSSHFNGYSRAVTGRRTSRSRARVLWAAPCSPKSCAKRCSARSNTPSATAGASSVAPHLCILHHLSPPDRHSIGATYVSPAALREAADNATFTLSEAACAPARAEGPHLGVDASAGGESVTQQLDQRVRNIITHRHLLELSSRRIGRCLP